MGNSASLICSHRLSLVANNNPATPLFPDHSYIKCDIDPKITVNITPNTENSFSFLTLLKLLNDFTAIVYVINVDIIYKYIILSV